MPAVSVAVCTHNPRLDHLARTLEALRAQTLPQDDWELLVVDNASHARVAAACSLAWHPRARHVREERLGLTPARLRAIDETTGDLVIFVDDDNLLSPDFLTAARSIHARHPDVPVFGAGTIEPDFEVAPPPQLRPLLQMLALRTVAEARWSNNPRDHASIPWGAGLCVSRRVAVRYRQFVDRVGAAGVLDRQGEALFSGGDDLLSWLAASLGARFGIVPELRVTHLIAAGRLTEPYFLKLIHDQAFSGRVLHYLLAGVRPRRISAFRYLHVLLHGLRRGRFSMRCQWAESRGEDRAARFIAARRLVPAGLAPAAETGS
jgi:glycosyltransferase involved in cell wall biosynthesis